MPRPDSIHGAVKAALIKDGWTITDDPFTMEYEDLRLFADLAAERKLATDANERRIVVEVKTFADRSPIHAFEEALGQYLVYQSILELTDPDRQLYLAIAKTVYNIVFERMSIQAIVERWKLALVIVDAETEEIVRWTK